LVRTVVQLGADCYPVNTIAIAKLNDEQHFPRLYITPHRTPPNRTAPDRTRPDRTAPHPSVAPHMPRPRDNDNTKGLSLDVDEFLEQERRRERALKMQDAIRRGRTTPVAIRLDRFTLRRLKSLAALRNTGYQTLLKQFVVERLYEEERRAGIIDARGR
jgi:hypothetical protein